MQASGTGTWLISPWPQRSELQLWIEAVADLAPCKGNKQKSIHSEVSLTKTCSGSLHRLRKKRKGRREEKTEDQGDTEEENGREMLVQERKRRNKMNNGWFLSSE